MFYLAESVSNSK